MAVVGRAQVLVSPSFTGFQRDVGREAAGAGKTFDAQMGKASPGIGSRIASGIGNTLKKGVAAVGIAAGAGLGFALVKGFGRLQAIDQAQAKLTGLGHSTTAVKGIMDDALKSVKGTAFGLDEAATTAGAVVAAGIKPGKQLQGVLTTVADTATIAGTSMSDMGAIFGSVAARGKLQGDDMMQLTSKGVPVLQFLAKHYGITAQEASKMVSEGKVDFQNFAAAMRENIGGAAQDSGKTFTGALANLKASLGRIGAGLLGGAFPRFAPLLTRITKAMAPLEDAAAKLGAVLGKKFAGPAEKIVGIIEKLSAAIGGGGGLKAVLGGVGPALGPATGALVALGSAGFAPLLSMIPGLSGLGGVLGKLGGPIGILVSAIAGLIATSPELRGAFLGVLQDLMSTLGGLGKQILPKIIPALVTLAKTLGGALATVLPVVGDALGTIAEALGGALAAVLPTVATLIANLAQTVFPVLVSIISQLLPPLAQLVASLLPVAVSIIQALAPVVMAVVTAFAPLVKAILPILVILIKALTPVLTVVAKVIGLVVTVAAKLVAAFLRWQTSTGIAGAALNGIKKIASAVAGWFTNSFIPFFTTTIPNAFRAVVNVAKTVGAAFAGVFRAIAAAGNWLWRSILKPVFTAIGKAFQAVGKVIRTIYNGWIAPIFQLFGAIVKWLVVKIIQVQLRGLRTAWSAMAALVRKVYNSVIKPIFNAFAAIGKWLWNRILKPYFNNIKIGFTALGTTIRRIYNTIVKPILNAFAALGKWLWNKVLKPAFNGIKTGWHALGTGVRSVYNSVIKPILNAFSKAAKAVKSVASTAFGGIRTAWSTTSKTLGSVFRGAMTATFNAFKTAGRGMKSAFGTAVSGIGTAWGKLSDLAKKPIRFIIDSVINKGLIKGFNSLARTFGTKEMKWLPLPFYRGGVYPGYTPGRDIGLAAVSGGEPIMRPEFGRAVGEPWVNAANAAARRGGVSGAKKFLANQYYGAFASGGIVKPTRSGRQNASYAGHSGIDFYGQVGDPILAATAGRITYTGAGRGYGNAIFEQAANGLQMVYGHTSAILAKVGQMVQAGQQIGRVGYSGNVRPPGPAGAHLHFEIAPGGRFALAGNRDATQKWLGGSGLVGKIIGAIKGIAGNLDPTALLKGAVTKIIGGAKWLAQTPFGQLAAEAPIELAERAIKYAKDKFASFFAGEGVASSWSGASVGSLGTDQLNNAATIIKTAKSLGFGQRGAIIGLMTAMQESTLRNLAGGDRDSVGLFQQRAPWGPFSARHNPAQAAAMFYQGGRGGQPGLRSKNWQSLPLGVAAQQVQVSAFPDAYNKWEGLARQLVSKGYARGTTSASRGLALIAEHGPELVTSPQVRMFRGGEQVKTAQQTARALSGPMRIEGTLDMGNGLKGVVRGVIAEEAGKALVSAR